MSNEPKDTKHLNPAQASKIADIKDIVPAKNDAGPDVVAPAEARPEPSHKPTSFKFPFQSKGRPDAMNTGSQGPSDSTKNSTVKGPKLK